MRQLISLVLVALCCAPPMLAQSPAAVPAATEKIQESQSSAVTSPPAQPQRVEGKIPDGTPVDIEAPYRINSMEFKASDKISFRVVNPVKIDGVTIIEQGATATARIDRAKRGGGGIKPEG